MPEMALLVFGAVRHSNQHHSVVGWPKLKRSDKAEAYKPWSDEECAKFEASSPPRALLTAYMLGRYTGQRGGDILV
jgi:hypothetical protein